MATTKKTGESNVSRISFAAIDPYIDKNIISPREKTIPAKEWIEWGDRNGYPSFLLSLAKTCPTLRSIISGTVDFIVGDDVSIAPLPTTSYGESVVNPRGDTIRQQVRLVGWDRVTFGGFALQVVRSASGLPVAIYHVPMQFLRSNKENTVFYYSEEWDKSGRATIKEYPAYMDITPERWLLLSDKERERHYNTILFVKNDHTQTYPLPDYCAAVKDCVIEVSISDYHLNALNNGFAGSVLVNFNNGVPADNIKKEVEKNFNEKFSGHQNAGRIVYSWNNNKDTAATITEVKVEDFGDRYKALESSSRQHIFTAFRANPNLFGIPTENLGFSQEEYESAFRLYNRTVVRPIQRAIVDAYERIYGYGNVLTITPFSLDEGAETNVQ